MRIPAAILLALLLTQPASGAFLGGAAVPSAPAGGPSPVLDSPSVSTATWVGSTVCPSATVGLCGTCTVATTGANEWIGVFLNTNRDATPIAAVTGIGGNSLTWARHAQRSDAGVLYPSLFVNSEIWWANAASAGTYTVTATVDNQVDAASMVCAAFAGTNIAAPFDTNASIPKTAISTGTSSTPSASGISTTAMNTTFVAMATDDDSNVGCGSGTWLGHPPSGFTDIALANQGGGTLWYSCVYLVYMTAAGAQSGVNVSFNGVSSVNFWTELVTALKP